MRCSVQPRGQMFVESYGYLFLVENMGRNIGKNGSENLGVNTTRKFLIMLSNQQQMHLKLFQKEQFKT